MRPIILTFVSYYLPGYKSGGPVRSISNLVKLLGDEFTFYIVTRDRDVLDQKAYGGIIVNSWNRVGKANVFYMSPENCSLAGFTNIMRETHHDVVYWNSFFDPIFTLHPLFLDFFSLVPKQPRIIAPRGEFSQGALALKPWKKRLYITFVQYMGLYKNCTWQASSEYESLDIQREMGSRVKNIIVAPDLSTPIIESITLDKGHKIDNIPLRIIFLSRITPKKNLDFALQVLNQISETVKFDIYGPIRDEAYWALCQKLIDQLPENIIVEYHGSVSPQEVPTIFRNHDLLFFPTLGENYGHVIAEALAVGTPILIGNTTPWRGLEKAGVGWDLPLDSEDKFLESISYCISLQEGEWVEWRRRIRSFASNYLRNQQTIDANRDLFLTAL